jgi:NitT/TauT family transport system ATP-binding protein
VLRTRGLAIGYGAEPVVEGVDLDVAAGRFVSLIGPSGSGKSSILRAVTGLVPPAAGSVALDVPLQAVGFLFQDDALLPWRTVSQNVALGLRIRGATRAAAEARALEWLSMLGLDRFGDRYPRQLSGGQRKRTALAQVLALEPALLLMDEPFASLDAIVRLRITEELVDWVERQRLTVLLVTHDLEEAIALSDVVYVLSQGPRASILGRHEVGIERPRHPLEARGHARFAPLLTQLWNELAQGPEAARRERPR